MKAVFITTHGALLDHPGERCALHHGAGAGLRLLAELDYRLVVLDDNLAGAQSTAPPTAPSTAPFTAPPADCADPEARLNVPRRRRGDRLEPASSHALPPIDAQDGGGAGASDGTKVAAAGAAPACGKAPAANAANAVNAVNAAEPGDRVADLLFREQLALQAYYRCQHQYGGAVPPPMRESTWGAQAAGRPADFLAGLHRASRYEEEVQGRLAGVARATPGGAPGSAPVGAFASALGRAMHGATLPHPAQQGGACACLPPQPRMLLQAAADHGIHLASSWMIGATLDAVEAGNRAGCRTMLIDNGSEQQWRLGRGRVPTRIAPDLHAAALLIVDEGQRMRPY